jgi:hypothetical protein
LSKEREKLRARREVKVKAWAGGWEGPGSEKAENAISRLKIQTLTTMPLKVFIIATFKRFLSD